MRQDMDMMKKAQAILDELVGSLALLRWSVLEGPPNQPGFSDAKSYQGIGASWFVTVVSWKPADLNVGDRRGYDGTCLKDGTIVRLTRDVAEKVFLYAAQKVSP